ncbi:MAG: DUF4142 domain-containing protein [Pseudomonas sp.]|nr:DUF4142 domain-containing protein [Pseudomonas sp.]
MNTIKIMKSGVLAVLFAFTTTAAWAQQMDAGEFIDEASAKGIAEIETAKMALETSEDKQVREFAEWMIKDHTKANEKLREIAQQKNIEMADDAGLLDQGKAMMLELRDGEDFNEAYINNQVVAHEQTIELFQRASRELDEEHAELHKLVEQTIPKLQEHHARVRQLQERMNASE